MHELLRDSFLATFFSLLAVHSPAQISTIVQRAEGAGARTAVCAIDLDSKRILYRHRSLELFKPASNQKVLTMAAVLEGLGADFEFVTEFRLRDGVLEVLASGDPNWNLGGSCDPRSAFARVATALKAKGVTAIRSIRLLPGTFTGPDRPAGWTRADAGRSYGAATGGLVLEAGCFQAEISVSSGASARVRLLSPDLSLPTHGHLALTDRRKLGGVYHLSLNRGSLRLSGHYYRPAGTRVVTGIVDDLSLVYRLTLEQALRRAGIGFDLQAPASSIPVHRESSRLRDAMTRILKHSENQPTEQCLRVLGAQTMGDGSFGGSLVALRQQLAKLAELPKGLVLDDGSGLSHDNRLTAKLLTDVLSSAARRPYSDLFVASLAVGGVDGTLEKRFRKGPLTGRIRGKTGTIRGVSTLCGFVQSPSGNLRAFAILMQRRGKKGASTRMMRSFQDQIVAALAATGTGSRAGG